MADNADNYDLDKEGEDHDEENEIYEHDDEYSLEDDEDPDDEEEEGSEKAAEDNKTKKERHTPAWKLLLEMMINPVEGWKRIRRSKNSVEDVSRECFYPLIGIAAASCFLECLWKHSISLNIATINALKTFVAFFFGYFLVLMLIKIFFPKAIKSISESDYGKKFVMYNLSTLALFYILYGCLPMIGPILVFLPIWTIYLILRGSGFFVFPSEKASLLRTLLCVFIIGTPIAVYWIIDLFL